MLSPRTETLLRSIVEQYIIKAAPVSSQSITKDCGLGVSAATIRNEMAQLEQEGYITRPHVSAGSIPSDKGYRHYVESLGEVKLPLAEQRLVSHLFHQVEQELDEWLNLAATIIARRVQNVALVTKPRGKACLLKHLGLVSLQDSLALLVVALSAARVRQQLITFAQTITQAELTVIANKINDIYFGLTSAQILAKEAELSPAERWVVDCLVKVMEAEDKETYEEPYLAGLLFALNQPELVLNHWLARNLVELIEQRKLLSSIIPSHLSQRGVQVIVGKENEVEAMRDYSVVLIRYGLLEEASGTISVIGPTRMPYTRAIAIVTYLSLVLTGLVTKLYGRGISNAN